MTVKRELITRWGTPVVAWLVFHPSFLFPVCDHDTHAEAVRCATAMKWAAA